MNLIQLVKKVLARNKMRPSASPHEPVRQTGSSCCPFSTGQENAREREEAKRLTAARPGRWCC